MAEQATKEPTMEEILASIRKIISEDGTPVNETAEMSQDDAPESMAIDSDDADDFIGLSESFDDGVQSGSDADGHLLSVEDLLQSDTDFGDLDAFNDLEVSEPQVQPLQEVFAEADIDETVAQIEADMQATPDDFEALEQFVTEPDIAPPAAAARPTPAMAAPEPAMATPEAVAVAPAEAALGLASVAGGTTIEALVSNLIRPMIKEWIDANLQTMVEQKVEAEIQQVANKVVAALRAE